MPKGSEELTRARREEIVSACAALYETMSFGEVTIAAIAAETTFTRTSIYNYFRTKEEIFLALLQREHEAWTADLESARAGAVPGGGFAAALAGTLVPRGCMLRLMSMNIYDMEMNSRIENLAEFKRSYAAARGAVAGCLLAFRPDVGGRGADEFLRVFFPFLFGVYPYTSHTEKQLRAMELAGIEPPRETVFELTRGFADSFLSALEI